MVENQQGDISITWTQAFLANFSNIWPGERPGVRGRLGFAHVYVFRSVRQRPGSV